MLLAGYSSGARWKIATASALLVGPTLLFLAMLMTAGQPFFLLSVPMVMAVILGFAESPSLPTHPPD
jgi:hypothetical protein